MCPDLNRLRSKIGIDRLDETQRKKLLKDFIEHGGKVIEEGEEKKTQNEVAKKHAGYIGATVAEESQKMRSPLKLPEKTYTGLKKAKKSERKAKIIHNLKIYIKGLMLKVLSSGGKKFSENFVRFIRTEAKNRLLEMHLLTGSFLKGSSSIKKIVLKLSTAENSYFYEFLYRLHDLFKEDEYSSIEKAVSKKFIPAGPNMEVFKQLFKKIYILSQYREYSRLFINKAIDIQLQKKLIKPEAVSSLKSKANIAIDAIHGEMLEKLHIAICRMAGIYFPLYSQLLDDFLVITDKDRIGYITRMEKIRRAEELRKIQEYLKKKQMELKEGEVEIKMPRHVQKGMQLLEKSIKVYEGTALLDDGNLIKLLDTKDKMYETAILLDVFDREYSFLLTSGKASFNIDFRDQKKVDIKEDLGHAYLLLCEARNEVKDYLDVLNEMKKVDNNLRLTIYQKNTMLEALKKKQSVLSKNARFKVSEAMQKIEDILGVVINDYNTTQRLLQNPSEKLVFDKHLEGKKKLENRTVLEAIVEAFLFTSSFHFILDYGKLGGSGILIETESGAEPSV
ncbi:MAG: hypothetical protein ACUVWJ_09390 [Spirochaetota bacterium]